MVPALQIEKMRSGLRMLDPNVLAVNTGFGYRDTGNGKGEFTFLYWQDEVLVTFPDFLFFNAKTSKGLSEFNQLLLLFYFTRSDGFLESGRWVSLSELPDGMFYKQAYQGYSGDRLVREFENNLEGVKARALCFGGQLEPFGDLAFSFQVLPKVSLLLVYWYGDEEFPPSSQILFDASVSHYLPTDICAYLGGLLAQKIIK